MEYLDPEVQRQRLRQADPAPLCKLDECPLPVGRGLLIRKLHPLLRGVLRQHLVGFQPHLCPLGSPEDWHTWGVPPGVIR